MNSDLLANNKHWLRMNELEELKEKLKQYRSKQSWLVEQIGRTLADIRRLENEEQAEKDKEATAHAA